MIELKNITKTYQMGDQIIRALDDVSLTVNDGEYIAIIGPSGSGKSTLMNVIGCLDNPSSGQYLLNGKDVSRLRDDQLADARNKNIGFVFQRFNLMGRMSAMRNVEMPARYGGMNGKQRHQQAMEALTAVGLADRVNHTPVELSGGQQQRVAIARALVNQPNILLADEPTGALDSKTGKDILDLFERLHRERGITVIVVTHDPNVARRANRVISIRDGRIESDVGSANAAHVNERANGHSARAASTAAEPAMPMGAEVAAGAGALVAESNFVNASQREGDQRQKTTNTFGDVGNGHTDEEAVAQAARESALHGTTKGIATVEMTNATPATMPAEKPITPKVTQSQRMPVGRLWKRGLIAVAIAVVVNVALGLLIGALVPIAGRLPMFSPIAIALLTALLGLIGVGVFALLNRFASKPVPLFRWIAVGALVLSFVPNVMLLANPAMLRQMAGGFGPGANAAQGGFPGGFGGQFGNGQGQGQFPGNAQGGRGGFAGGPGGFGGRGAGPLGFILGGNNAQGARGGAGLLAIPIVAFTLLHVVAFSIIVGVLTRRPRGQSAGPQLSASGLT